MARKKKVEATADVDIATQDTENPTHFIHNHTGILYEVIGYNADKFEISGRSMSGNEQSFPINHVISGNFNEK